MKKYDNKWNIRLASLALAGVCLCGASLAVGDENDPLVSLSYLNQTAIPEILQQVEDQAGKHQSDLMAKFKVAIDAYKSDKEQGTSNATYSVVTLKKGQKLELGVGCEVMLRIGTATVSSATYPALIDVSTGSSVGNGTALTTNHLYMATIVDRTLTATANTVKILVRGSYTIL
jgi:hypothetical protein